MPFYNHNVRNSLCYILCFWKAHLDIGVIIYIHQSFIKYLKKFVIFKYYLFCLDVNNFWILFDACFLNYFNFNYVIVVAGMWNQVSIGRDSVSVYERAFALNRILLKTMYYKIIYANKTT